MPIGPVCGKIARMTEQRLDEKPARTSRLDWVDIANDEAQ